MGSEAAIEAAQSGAIAPHVPTWKLALGAIASVLVLAIVLWVAGMPRAAQIFGGLATLVIIMFSAFRKPPPRREKPGDAAGINFGR